MARQIIIPPRGDFAPLQQVEQTPQDLVPVDYYVRMGAAVGVCVTVVTMAVTGGVIFYFPAMSPYAWKMFFADFLAGLVVFGVASVIWTRLAATRHWRIDDLERGRRHYFEDDQYSRAVNANPSVQTISSGERLRLVGYEILAMHYAEGKQATRQQCEKEKVATQDDWACLNNLFQKIGIKNPRGWNDDVDYGQALKLYKSVGFNDDRSVFIQRDGNHSERVPLA